MSDHAIIERTLSYDGVCNLRALIKTVHDWLLDRKWEDRSGSEDKFLESFYFEKQTVRGKEVWIWWRCQKKGGTPYIMNYLNVDFHLRDIKDVEIVYKGQKLKAQQGKIEVMISGKMVFDPGQKLEKSFFGTLFWSNGMFLRGGFPKKYKAEIDAAQGELDDTAVKMIQAMKEYLEVKGFLPKQEPFQPAKGLI